MVDELLSFGKKGKTISDEASLDIPEVVGVGKLDRGTAPEDGDQDGMPDAWEQANSLDPKDDTDRNADRNGDGWTNLEEYINSLAH